MFIVWGNKWKYQPKEDGMREKKQCPECDEFGEFVEVIPSEYFSLYWIPLIKTREKKPVLECPYCHEHFYITSADHIRAYKKDARDPPGE